MDIFDQNAFKFLFCGVCIYVCVRDNRGLVPCNNLLVHIVWGSLACFLKESLETLTNTYVFLLFISYILVQRFHNSIPTLVIP